MIIKMITMITMITKQFINEEKERILLKKAQRVLEHIENTLRI